MERPSDAGAGDCGRGCDNNTGLSRAVVVDVLYLGLVFGQIKGRILDVDASGRCGLKGRGVGMENFWNGIEPLLDLALSIFSFKQ